MLSLLSSTSRKCTWMKLTKYSVEWKCISEGGESSRPFLRGSSEHGSRGRGRGRGRRRIWQEGNSYGSMIAGRKHLRNPDWCTTASKHRTQPWSSNVTHGPSVSQSHLLYAFLRERIPLEKYFLLLLFLLRVPSRIPKRGYHSFLFVLEIACNRRKIVQLSRVVPRLMIFQA